MKSISKELVGAAAIPIILSMLKNNDSYGYAIVQKVKEISSGQIKWTEASIYPVLKKMENEGMVKSYWRVEQNERPRKYYSIQENGVQQLALNREEWSRMFSVFEHFWHSPEPNEVISQNVL
jgi:PadR family transcriptional regulator PadR